MIEEFEISESLATKAVGKKIFSFASIDSTNTFGKSLDAEKAPHGTLIIADEQTKGRGRMERSWEAQKGKNLLFSLVLYPEFDSKKTGLLPFAGSLAAADAVETVTGLSASCKWPNDVLINNKKVCGMLLETVSGGAELQKIVFGFGINVNQQEFPDSIRGKATSLFLESGREIDRRSFLKAMLESFEHRYDQLAHFPAHRLLHDWKMKALLFGKKIIVIENDTGTDATAIDLADDGSLLIETAGGERRNIYAGDVSLAYHSTAE